MNYDAIDIADLKELFKDGNRSAGSNFSTLIDYFGSNAVKDNGDGTIEVNGKSVDITNIADFKPSDYAILSVDANFTGGLQSNGVDVATETDVSNLDTGISNLDSKVVHLSGTETVTGDKNFTGALQKGGVTVPSTTDVSTAVNQAALTAGTDVNTLTTDGVYSFSAIALTNFYSTATQWGFIHVYHQGGLVWQIAVTAAITNGYLVRMESGSPLYWKAWTRVADDSTVVHNTGTETIAGDKTFADPVDIESSLFVQAASTFSTQPTNGTQVYPVYATSDNDTDAETLISTLQASGFSGLIGIPES